MKDSRTADYAGFEREEIEASIVQRFEAIVRRYAGRIALSERGENWTVYMRARRQYKVQSYPGQADIFASAELGVPSMLAKTGCRRRKSI